jgi:hypothetical protein
MDKANGFRHDRLDNVRDVAASWGIIEKVERFQWHFRFLNACRGYAERPVAEQGALLMAGTDQPSPWWSRAARRSKAVPDGARRDHESGAAWFTSRGLRGGDRHPPDIAG